MKNGPDLWDSILEKMPAGSVIAGGAVRDYLLGVEPKDIDVFMGVPNDLVDFTTFNIGDEPRSGLFRIDNFYERLEEYQAMTNIDLVSSGTMFDFKVDAVVMTNFTDGAALVSEFDFAINQCWYTKAEGVRWTEASTVDRICKMVTLLQTDRLERSQKRFARFNERMGGGWILI